MKRVSCLLLVISCLIPAGNAMLEKVFDTPPHSFNWDEANRQANDSLLTPIFNILKTYKIPSATMGYRLNPKSTVVSQEAPPAGQRNLHEDWWMAGYRIDYRSPMRVSSITKPFTVAVWTTYLSAYKEDFFYNLWVNFVGPLPVPKDPRVLLIRVRHLLAETSGLDNAKIGFNPAFTGRTALEQIGGIVDSTTLRAAPGVEFRSNDFWFMVLAAIAESYEFRTQIRPLFSRLRSWFAASDDIPVNADLAGGAAEPSTYVVQFPDRIRKVSVMKGSGNLVINVASLTWFGTQYWMGGASAGQRITASNFESGSTYIATGGMPGTMSFLIQWTTPGKLVSSICIIINTRISPANGRDAFYMAMKAATARFLQQKFKNF